MQIFFLSSRCCVSVIHLQTSSDYRTLDGSNGDGSGGGEHETRTLLNEMHINSSLSYGNAIRLCPIVLQFSVDDLLVAAAALRKITQKCLTRFVHTKEPPHVNLSSQWNDNGNFFRSPAWPTARTTDFFFDKNVDILHGKSILMNAPHRARWRAPIVNSFLNYRIPERTQRIYECRFSRFLFCFSWPSLLRIAASVYHQSMASWHQSWKIKNTPGESQIKCDTPFEGKMDSNSINSE